MSNITSRERPPPRPLGAVLKGIATWVSPQDGAIVGRVSLVKYPLSLDWVVRSWVTSLNCLVIALAVSSEIYRSHVCKLYSRTVSGPLFSEMSSDMFPRQSLAEAYQIRRTQEENRRRTKVTLVVQGHIIIIIAVLLSSKRPQPGVSFAITQVTLLIRR